MLKNRRDLDVLQKEHWYRIPAKYAPKRRFTHLAFYQPAIFGKKGKRIKYYSRAIDFRTFKRSDLLPYELSHPNAYKNYIRIGTGRIKKLSRPIRNTAPRRIYFGFTTLNKLLSSKNILQLYGIAPTEELMKKALKKAGIRAVSQYRVKCGEKRFCLDFAVFCQKGKIAIECDNVKAHSSSFQKNKDKIKDALLRRHGWIVIRLKEPEIIFDLKGCLLKIKRRMRNSEFS